MFRGRKMVLWLIVSTFLIGCQGSEKESANENKSGDNEAKWLLDKIARPDGPPKSANALAQHIQYGVQEQDEEMLRKLFFQETSEGFRLKTDNIDRNVSDLLSMKRRKLAAIEVVELDAEEISRRIELATGRGKSAKLEPGLTHELKFEYEGPMLFGSSRITALSVGESGGFYYLVTVQEVDDGDE